MREQKVSRDAVEARAKADGTYMKAPNGKQSNLSPRQWVQVRTKAFKDWFGDWELSAKVLKIISGIKEHGFNSFEDAKAWAKENIVRTLTNEEKGGKGEIRISNNAISKFLSESAVAKSDNKDVHLSVLRVLPDVIRENVDAEQHPDYKKGEDGNRSAKNGINENITIHRLYGAVDIDGKLYRVKVTLKEDRTNVEPKKTYSYEATKIELLAGQHEETVTSSRNSNNSISAAKLLENVESSKEKGTLLDNLNVMANHVAENQSADVEIEKGKLLDELDMITNPSSQENSTLSRYKDTRLFSILQTNSSKVVDENGEPLVVYHGTQSEFSSFDKDVILERKDGIKGFYFVPEKRRGSVAGYYANDKGKIMPLFLNIKKPFARGTSENIVAEDIKDNFDGIITTSDIDFAHRYYDYEQNSVATEILNNGDIVEIVAFEPTQIKSATDNIGTFDRTNTDIRYSKSENISKTDEDDDTLYRSDEAIKNKIEELFNQAISGEFKGKLISIGRLTDEGKAYLEHISGIVFKDKVDFVLNPSDLVHINKGHFGNNETDERNIPLDIEDIRSIADVISNPDKVIFFKEGEGSNMNMFYFFKEAEDGTYNLMEIYSDRKGNLTAKTFYKTRKDATQRLMDIEKSLLPTSETYSGAILSDAKIPQMFESASVKEENSNREVTEAEHRRMDFTPSL